MQEETMGRLPVGVTRCLELVRGITSESSQERRIWADVTSEWLDVGELADYEARPIAAVLAWAAVVETDVVNIREGLLNSLDGLAQRDLVPATALEQVTTRISPQDLDVSEVEYYETLVNKLREQTHPSGADAPGLPPDERTV